MPTTAKEVLESFESSFREKLVLAESLELLWLRKAVARYSIEVAPLQYDSEENTFDTELDGYVIDTLAAFMKQLYQEREVSRVNKIVSVVTKDVSIDGRGSSKTAAKNELDYCDSKSTKMACNQQTPAYS